MHACCSQVVLCSWPIYERMAPRMTGLWLLLGGGILYTAGVPFNVRNKRTLGIPDHTIWHIFVLGGSALHYVCVFVYLLEFPYPEAQDAPAAPPALTM